MKTKTARIELINKKHNKNHSFSMLVDSADEAIKEIDSSFTDYEILSLTVKCVSGFGETQVII